MKCDVRVSVLRLSMFKWIKKSLKLGDAESPSKRPPSGLMSYEDRFQYRLCGWRHSRPPRFAARAEERIEADLGADTRALVIYLGDYIDRGPSSADVIEHLLNPITPRFTRLCLRGNHEDMFMQFLQSPREAEGWLDAAGRENVFSYKLDPKKTPRQPQQSLGHGAAFAEPYSGKAPDIP